MNPNEIAVDNSDYLDKEAGEPIAEAERELPEQSGEPISEKKAGHQKVEKAPEPPNAGLNAWLTVLAGFFIYINTWGLTATYGAFQTFYQSDLLSSHSSSTIAWIGSMQSFLVVIVGVISGPLFDIGYLRHLMVLGCFLVVFGMMMISLANNYYQVFLAQGICVGLGAGMIYVPAIALISTQFSTKRPIAIGLASSGSAIGGIIFPIMFRNLQPKIGFPWAIRSIAFINLGTCLMALLIFMRQPAQPPKKIRTLFDIKAFGDINFTLFSLSLFFIFLSFYVPLFYVPSYAVYKLGVDENLAFYLLAVINAGSFFGRTLPYLISKYFGPMQTFAFWTFVGVILLFSWIGIHSLPGFFVFCVIWGFLSGVLVTAPPAAVAHPVLSPSLSVIGLRLGMSWLLASVGVLCGSPIVGALVDIKTASFLKAQCFAGAMMALGALCLVWPLVTILRYKAPHGST